MSNMHPCIPTAAHPVICGIHAAYILSDMHAVVTYHPIMYVTSLYHLHMHAVVPPVEQWLNGYIFKTWTLLSYYDTYSYINLHYIGDNPNGVLIDGVNLSSHGVQWANISLPGMQGVSAHSARLQVSNNDTHVVKHVTPEESVSVITYGIAIADSYIKPAGMAVADLLANPRCPLSGLTDTVGGINSTNIVGYSNCSRASYAEGSTCTATCSPGTSGGHATCTSSPQGAVWVASDCRDRLPGTAVKPSIRPSYTPEVSI
jgi:hypothetical protein